MKDAVYPLAVVVGFPHDNATRAARKRLRRDRLRIPPRHRFPLLPTDTVLKFEDRPGYLYAEVTGPRDSHEISKAYWRLVAAGCQARRTSKLMVFENLGAFEGERDMSLMVDAIIALGMDRLKVAFVVGRVEEMARLEHAEILAMERGANGRVFESVALAERWLRHGGE